MQIERYTDPALFRAAVDEFFHANMLQYNHAFSITRSLTVEQVAERKLWLTRLHRDGATVGVAIITMAAPLRPLWISELSDDAMRLVAQALREDGIRLDGVIGELTAAQRMAGVLGAKSREHFRLGHHVLDSAPVIAPCAGKMRAATQDDYEMVVEWEDAFVRECGLPYNRQVLEGMVRDRLKAPVAQQYLWEVDGVPVAGALGRATLPIARIGMVYTVPEFRGRGYAGALVGTLSAALQSEGCNLIFLATDLANPTSNGVYRRIGYRQIGEGTHLDIIPRDPEMRN